MSLATTAPTYNDDASSIGKSRRLYADYPSAVSIPPVAAMNNCSRTTTITTSSTTTEFPIDLSPPSTPIPRPTITTNEHKKPSFVSEAETEPIPSFPRDNDIRLPKRYSTSQSFTIATTAKRYNKPPVIRHHTDVDSIASSSDEAFQRELSARRKAFRRLSRNISNSNNNNETDDEDRVLIGTRVSEGHQNYVLMYNMLTGIRIAVGRVSAKRDRPLTDHDFLAAHKLVFDV